MMITAKRLSRKKRVRAKVSGTKERPRLSVFRSNTMLYAQLIDDENARTVAEARGKDANKVGEDIAAKAKKAKIVKIVFDRSGYKYHGKVKALADAVRAGGIEF